jgi:hypothetical protein
MRSRILAAYGPVDKHFQEGAAELQIPIRLRSGQALGCARDDKGRATLLREVVAGQGVVFFTFAESRAHDRSGQNGNS